MRTLVGRGTLLLLFGCGSDGHEAVEAADAAVADAPPGCTPSGLTAEEASRTVEAAAVTASAKLDNALLHCGKTDISFGIVLDTHSFDLLSIDLATSAVVETSSAGVLPGPAEWIPGSESSHHREGKLLVRGGLLVGATWLRLTIRDVAEVDRVFEWDEAFLAHDQP